MTDTTQNAAALAANIEQQLRKLPAGALRPTLDRLIEPVLADVRQLAALAARAVPEWVSVDDERKPTPGVPILVAVEWKKLVEDEDGLMTEMSGVDVTEGVYIVTAHGSYFESYQGTHGDQSGVTHWMPLPSAPGAASPTPPQAAPEQASESKCSCGDRPASQCDEEWGPKCSLGNSAEHARRAPDDVTAQVNAALSATVPNRASTRSPGSPDPACPQCHGSGIDGDCAADGSVVDIDCGCMFRSSATAPEAETGQAMTEPHVMQALSRAMELAHVLPGDRADLLFHFKQHIAALATQPVAGQAANRFLESRDLYELLMNVQNGIDAPGHASMANGLIQQLDKLRAALRATKGGAE